VKDPWLPLGCALLDYHQGATSATFLVSSSLWEDEETPVADYYRPLGKPLPEIDRRALALCRGRVLDLGAGAGRHALELQSKGLEVTALDISPQAIEVMRARGVVDARRGDLFTFAEAYDTVLLLMHGVGVVGTLAGLRRFFDRLPALLAAGGQVLFDSADLSGELRESGINEARLHDHETYFGEVRFRLRYRDLAGPEYPWLFVDPHTLEQRARAAGFATEVVARGERGGYLARLWQPAATAGVPD
jgi:SAM-dependent methyltransferase